MNLSELKQRFHYWFDNQMSRGSLSLIKLLTIFTFLSIFLITLLGLSMGLAEDGAASLLWDTSTTLINQWMPFYEDGDGSISYLILMTLAAVAGLLVSSILIGIISTAIEEKITNLKHGNSVVLEKDHYVVLGFTPGEYTLIQQLILAAAGSFRCIVVADPMEHEELESNIRDNLEIPKNIRLICRSIDIYDPVALERLSLDKSHSIVINPTDAKNTAKILLAVSLLINDTSNTQVRVGAIIDKEEYQFPKSIARKHNVNILDPNEVLAKIIAHSCTQPGLSDTFREILNFEGSELYHLALPESVGMTFLELSCSLDYGTPIGILRNGQVLLNPAKELIIQEDDMIIIFTEDRSKPKLVSNRPDGQLMTRNYPLHHAPQVGKIVILGYNDSFETVIHELPDNVTEITAEAKKRYRDKIQEIGSRQKNIHIQVYDKDITAEGALLKIAKSASHLVLLSDHEKEDEDADMKIIFRIMHLRDFRDRYNLNFNITAEMRKEKNQVLISGDDHIDFVVASNMSSLILAQLAENPELIEAFHELFSIEGNEFYLKTAHELNAVGTHTALELRQMTLAQGYVFIGYRLASDKKSVFNPSLSESITLTDEDHLIVIGLDVELE